jgi:hypothetical protein
VQIALAYSDESKRNVSLVRGRKLTPRRHASRTHPDCDASHQQAWITIASSINHNGVSKHETVPLQVGKIVYSEFDLRELFCIGKDPRLQCLDAISAVTECMVS